MEANEAIKVIRQVMIRLYSEDTFRADEMRDNAQRLDAALEEIAPLVELVG